MDYLQYYGRSYLLYTKWSVLNLVINGLPSIPQRKDMALDQFMKF